MIKSQHSMAPRILSMVSPRAAVGTVGTVDTVSLNKLRMVLNVILILLLTSVIANATPISK
jgi:hypothetical protein